MNDGTPFPKKAIMSLIGLMLAPLSAYSANPSEALKTETVEVIATTPLPSVGVPINQVPSNIQTVKGKDIQQQGSISISDYMIQNMQGVSVNDTQNNPYQPDVTFRGYTASPLLGTPQGLSVFVDGVRVNEPFGDVVSWDLIPMNALANMTLIPGSNPLYGLNTLGGALSLQTKSGRTHSGGAVEAYAGSWGRRAASAEYGGVSKDGSVDYFFSANAFKEDGWRDASPSDVRQVFGKVGWQNETTKLDLSYTGADNELVGNGLTPLSMLSTLGRSSILTKPDITNNKMSFLNLTGSHWINDDVMFSGNVYYRNSRTRTLNGDINDDASDPSATLADCAGAADPETECRGAINRSNSKKSAFGFTGQWTFNQDFMSKKNQFTTGFGYDHSKAKFTQSTEYGNLNASRGIDGSSVFDDNQVDLHGKTRTWSVFATDTLSLNPFWHLTLSGRYNYTKVNNRDQITPTGDESLSGDAIYNRFNPAVGINFTPTKDLTVYASYNEGSRAPTAIELGCANPKVPCKLPNAMAGDPPLNQVVAKTIETGMRGNLTSNVKWNASVYRAQNYNDIQFILAPGTTSGFGYFDNVGKTRRVGLDTGLTGSYGDFSWAAGYSFIHATYQSDFELANEVNTSSDGTKIQVSKGDRIVGIPEHQLKLRGQYQITKSWTVGTNIITFSDQYARGNENNKDQGEGAKVAGYTIVNLDTRYEIGKGWQLFAKANNIFDKEYSNVGMLGTTYFDASGSYLSANTEAERSNLVSPGAPRAGWVGIRYEFDKVGASSNQVND